MEGEKGGHRGPLRQGATGWPRPLRRFGLQVTNGHLDVDLSVGRGEGERRWERVGTEGYEADRPTRSRNPTPAVRCPPLPASCYPAFLPLSPPRVHRRMGSGPQSVPGCSYNWGFNTVSTALLRAPARTTPGAGQRTTDDPEELKSGMALNSSDTRWAQAAATPTTSSSCRSIELKSQRHTVYFQPPGQASGAPARRRKELPAKVRAVQSCKSSTCAYP